LKIFIYVKSNKSNPTYNDLMEWVGKAREKVKSKRIKLATAKQMANTGDTPEERMMRWIEYNEARWSLGIACQTLLDANHYHDLTDEKQKIMAELLTATILKMDADETKIEISRTTERYEKAKENAMKVGLPDKILW
jgi:hypothetical protein